jgi:hypothetical protein
MSILYSDVIDSSAIDTHSPSLVNLWDKKHGNCTGLDITKRLMSSPKCRSVEVINNSARPGLNHREVNYINYK